jgi:hypothetical protein
MAEELQIVGHGEHCECIAGDADVEEIVGSFFSSIKKGIRKVGKVAKGAVRATGNAVSAVGRNKVFQVAMPVAAIAAHTTSKSMGGKPVFKGTLGRAIDAGGGFALGKAGGAVSAIAKTAAGNAFVFPASGVPSLQATATANALVKATRVPATAAKARGVISRTRALAAKGDPSAKRAVTLLATAAKAQVKPKPKPTPKPPVKATPRPASSASSASSAPAAAPVRGLRIITEGAQRGRIDFSSGRWASNAKGQAGIVVHTAGAQRGRIVRSRWSRA